MNEKDNYVLINLQKQLEATTDEVEAEELKARIKELTTEETETEEVTEETETGEKTPEDD